MDIQVILFGQLTDIAGGNRLLIKEVADSNELLEQLKLQYPALAASAFIIAVDKDIIHGNTHFNENQVVALLPPYSGG